MTAETVNGSITQLGAAKDVELQSVNGDIDTSKGSGRIKAEAVNGTRDGARRARATSRPRR